MQRSTRASYYSLVLLAFGPACSSPRVSPELINGSCADCPPGATSFASSSVGLVPGFSFDAWTPPFLPELDYHDKSADEWLAAFEQSGGLDRDALWSLFFWDARSPRFIAGLRESLHRRELLSTEIDAILDHWQVEHECIPLSEYLQRTRSVEPTYDIGQRSLPTRKAMKPVEGHDVALDAALHSNDPATALLQLSRADRNLRNAARKKLLGLARLSFNARPIPASEAQLHSPKSWVRCEDDLLAEVLVEGVDDILSEIEGRGKVDSMEREFLHDSSRCHPRLRELVIGRSRSWLERSDSLATVALQLLCHLNVSDASVRQAYVRHMKAHEAETGEFMLPCLSEHDEETLSLLNRAALSMNSKERLLGPAQAAGLLGDADSPVTQALLSVAGREDGVSWYALFEAGCALELEILEPGDLLDVSPMLGIRIRALRAHDEPHDFEWRRLLALFRQDYATDGFSIGWQAAKPLIVIRKLGGEPNEYAELALTMLHDTDAWLYSHDLNCLSSQLLSMELTPRQAALFRHGFVLRCDDDPSAVLAHYGVDSITYAALLRALAYRNQPGGLRHVLRVTHLSSTDEEYLARAASGARIESRREALRVMRDFQLDTPGLRTLAEAAREDSDAEVRSLAAEWLAATIR